jgi:integrase
MELPGAMRKTLTDRLLRSLKPRQTSFDVMDALVPALGIRILPSGKRSFVLIGRFPGGRNPTRRALGGYGELTLERARGKARDWLELIRRGVDPQAEEQRLRQAEQRRQRNNFEAIAEDFIKDKVAGERKGREVERDIRREFIPRWGNKPITDITAQDIRDVVKAAKDRGAPYQAHNLLVLAKRMFSWTIDQQVYGLESSPCEQLKPKAIIGKKAFRSRVLSDEELRAFWRATEGLGYPYGPLFRLLAFTGQRKSEVAEARWSEIDFDRRLWTIPADRMKADAAHVVPLSNDVVAILRGLPRFNRGECLFSTCFGAKPVNGFSKAKQRVDKRMLDSLQTIAQTLGEKPPTALKPWVIHDIRRTMRTGLSALPVPDLVRELVIAHTKPGLHKVYDQHAYLDEKRRALDLWSERLREIARPTPDGASNVIALRG